MAIQLKIHLLLLYIDLNSGVAISTKRPVMERCQKKYRKFKARPTTVTKHNPVQ